MLITGSNIQALPLRESLSRRETHEKFVARKKAAENFNTAPEVLAVLATNKDWDVRDRVAGNLNTSSETLAYLAGDESWLVRFEVAKNIKTPIETLIHLAVSGKKSVRRVVLNNLVFISFLEDYKTVNGLDDMPDSWVLKILGVPE